MVELTRTDRYWRAVMFGELLASQDQGKRYFGKLAGQTQRFEVYTLKEGNHFYLESFRDLETAIEAGYEVAGDGSDRNLAESC